MSWWKTGERRQVVSFPEGREWRCDALDCDGAKPEGERGKPDYGCPQCGGAMSRILVRL